LAALTGSVMALTDPAQFLIGQTVEFTKPMMSCPNPDDATATEGKSPEWLAARDCHNLPEGKKWVVVSSGGSRGHNTFVSYGCVIDTDRWGRAQAQIDPMRLNWWPIQNQLAHECRYVVNKFNYETDKFKQEN
jgi:hypothetical protein